MPQNNCRAKLQEPYVFLCTSDFHLCIFFKAADPVNRPRSMCTYEDVGFCLNKKAQLNAIAKAEREHNGTK